MNILKWLKGGSWSKPAPVVRMENTSPPPAPKFDPKNIRVPEAEDLLNMTRAQRELLEMDHTIVGCAFVGEQNGKTVRVDPLNVMMRTNGTKTVYTYESSK